MRNDPRAACANETERCGWAIVHDLIAHPLMALTLWSGPALRFHDWTSMRAWPRVVPTPGQVLTMLSRRYGALVVRLHDDGIYGVQHPSINHEYVTKAADAVAAVELAERWFDGLGPAFQVSA